MNVVQGSVAVGRFITIDSNNAIALGSNLQADKDYELVVGVGNNAYSTILAQAEYEVLFNALKRVEVKPCKCRL